MFFSNSAILLRIAVSVVLSAFFDDADKFLLKFSNCCRVRLSISWASCSVLALIRSARDCSEVSQLGAVLKERVVSPFMENEEEHLCADAAFAGNGPREKMIAAGYTPHVRPRGEEKLEKMTIPGFKARRWVVEACHSWLNRFRKLTIRYEKLNDTHIALTHLAAAIIALRKVGVIYG